MSNNPESGVYIITCTANGKTYVGSSQNAPLRLRGHFRALRLNKHHNAPLQSEYLRFGEHAFVSEFYSMSVLVMRREEKAGIAHYRNRGLCYNMANVTNAIRNKVTVAPAAINQWRVKRGLPPRPPGYFSNWAR